MMKKYHFLLFIFLLFSSLCYGNDKNKTANPTVTISSFYQNYTNNSFPITITFSEAVKNFALSDLIITNATGSVFNKVNDTEYTVTVTPINEGLVTINIPAGSLQNLGNEDNLESNTFSIIYDVTKPVVDITTNENDPTNATSFDVTFTFSENMADFDETYVYLTNATISNFTYINDALFTATITPINDGIVFIEIPEDEAEDNANNGNIGTLFSINVDTVKPTLTITSTVTNPTNNAFTTNFVFSEDIIDFDINNISLNNATASNFTQVDPKTYSALITPSSDGLITVDVLADVSTDEATNGNIAANQFSVVYDGTRPSIVISSTINNNTNSSFTITITFSEDVSGFTIDDIVANNANVSNFIITNAKEYSALITPVTEGAVTVNILENSANDDANNGNTASNTFSINYDVTPPSVPIITHIDDYTCANNTTTTGDNTLIFNGTTDINTTVEIFVNGISVGTTNLSSNGNWIFDYTNTILADGTYTITSRATDVANNQSTISAGFTIIIDSVDTDGDTLHDFCDDDDDNDGVLDDVDNSYLPNPGQEDSDGDGIADVEEDCDNDGIINYYDDDVASCQDGIIAKKRHAFSPNGDGINDTWVIEDILLYPNNRVSIYNRSGKLVYQMTGYNNSFDGFSNKKSSSEKLPVGAYFYIIEFNTQGSKPAKGWLYINY